ncbi:MAG: hypothetical protein LBD34_01795 [Puniceicoccales bacterium]|jgi:hypothetical protein|nr:hypothetical protein [Puniceicoccales bacterium]
MKGAERTKFSQDYGQVVARPVEKDELFSDLPADRVEKTVTAGEERISIPGSKVPENALGIRSVIATVSRNLPTCWLEFTVENIANLTENKIAQLLSHKGIFDASKLGFMLFLSDGFRIAARVVDCISGYRLLKLIGEGLVSVYYFTCIFFEEKFFAGDRGQVPTTESLCSIMREKCKPQSPSSPQEKVEGQTAALVQAMMEAYADEGKRREFESQLQKIVDLILSKLPPPTMGNQMYWDNIRRATRDGANRFYGTDGEKTFEKLKKRFPVLSPMAWLSRMNGVNTGERRRNKEPRKGEKRFPVLSLMARSSRTNGVNTSKRKDNRQSKKGWKKENCRIQKFPRVPLGKGISRYR